MAKKITVITDEFKESHKHCGALEDGNILFFPTTPFAFPKEDIEFLLTQKQAANATRKNIAYKPQIDQITNHDASDPVAAERLKEILKNYSARVTEFLNTFLEPYSDGWRHDYASFRPFQEQGRKLRIRARNDLLHVDSFPTRPLHGMRILRFFTNINPTESRKWITSDGFAALASKYAHAVGIPTSVRYDWKSHLKRTFQKILKKAGVKVPLRSPYDHFMLKMHNFLKENEEFQKTCIKDHWDFPPGCCWAVFTDQVSHAALAGQYALEQTFLIPKNFLLFPEKSPLAVLEQLSGNNLVDAHLAT